MKTTEQIDLDTRFENCLLADPKYQEETSKLERLRNEDKRLSMAESFGVYDDGKNVEAETEAIDAVLEGKELSDFMALSPKERTRRKRAVLQRAIQKQEAIVKKMEPGIWREAKDKYEDAFEHLFCRLIDKGEDFAKALLELQQFQNKVKTQAGIPELIFGRWSISPEFLQRIGVNLDGFGFFPTTLQQWKTNWRGEQSKNKRSRIELE